MRNIVTSKFTQIPTHESTKEKFIAFGYLNYVLFTRKIDKEIFTYTIQSI